MDDGRGENTGGVADRAVGVRKGHVDGAVGISTKHPLAFVNRGGATAADVLRLASAVKRGVARSLRRLAAAEPVFVGFRRGHPDVEFLTKHKS